MAKFSLVPQIHKKSILNCLILYIESGPKKDLKERRNETNETQ